jgi:hypothetical protein
LFREVEDGESAAVTPEPRLSRLAKNEAVFREVNERISEITADLAEGAAYPERVDGLICECSDPLCLERIGPLEVAEYEAVRQDPRRFLVAVGHEASDVEHVVEEHRAYSVVEKNEGVPADVARERDPRS